MTPRHLPWCPLLRPVFILGFVCLYVLSGLGGQWALPVERRSLRDTRDEGAAPAAPVALCSNSDQKGHAHLLLTLPLGIGAGGGGGVLDFGVT